MNQREANMLCLRDTLEHLSSNQQRLEWMEDRSPNLGRESRAVQTFIGSRCRFWVARRPT